MKKVILFYFSGTGNTKLVAEHISEEFQELNWETTVVNLEKIYSEDDMPNIEKYDLIGIGAQVIGYTMPRRVKQFVKLMPVSNNQPTFIFRTAGGVAATNYAASHTLIKMLRKKNYYVFYERLFSIGSNWVMKFDDEIMKQLYEATKIKIKIMCREVIEKKERFYVTSFGFRLKKKFISSQAEISLPFLGKNLKIESTCNQCMSCVKNCPSKNIHINRGKIKFKSNCSACLRCVYNCPQQAIAFRIFKFIPLKNGYNVKQSLCQSGDFQEITNGKIPPFFEKYISDHNV